MVRFTNKPIGILGGSFDPAHKGHLAISNIAIKKIKLSKVLWIVTKQNPFKGKAFYSLSQRMTKAKKTFSCKRWHIISVGHNMMGRRVLGWGQVTLRLRAGGRRAAEPPAELPRSPSLAGLRSPTASALGPVVWDPFWAHPMVSPHAG